ncbi:phenolic glucoside malonyltransferase 1-like [Pyrus ussuriensis x Pyrus communis]|uniref:Phenolic glucoside malonyltransferase 1-like n=1 Tax=Pyrus ussuriensis x Pyrus communis TaxID=2448454 RepID=A0A5N5G4Q6_9ROSA|nr:phenolic glucoside malonyltransferase 1-like [Pyrus ussuriensis x Pyrus communis]
MADANKSIKLVEICRIAPQHADQEFSLPLTFFDIIWLKFPPIQRLYFYEIVSSSKNTFFFDSILPKLKTALSLTLHHFPPLAGNITWPQDSPIPILSYLRGDAVSVTVAESDADFHHLVSSNSFNIEAKEYHPLVPQLDACHEKAAALALQITLFPNNGFSIGTSVHHAALDGKMSTMFVKSWAYICKHESDLVPDQLKPFYDRRVIPDPTRIDLIYSNHFLNIDLERPNNRSLMPFQFEAPQPDSVRGCFQFTPTKIEAIRQLVKAKKQQHQSVPLSKFCVTIAYAWICLVKAEEIKSKKIRLIFGVDCRSRLDAQISANYFGNCIAPRIAVAESEGVFGEDGLVVAVNAISEALEGLDNRLLNGAEAWMEIMQPQADKLFSVAGSQLFRVYDTDFGWGRPRKVEVVSIDRSGAISFSDSKDGDGSIEIGVVLKKQCMEVFASLFAKGIEDL